MLIVLSPITYSSDAPIVLRADPSATDLQNATRRVSRTATLDGGCLITDTGFSHSDRTFRVKASVDATEEVSLWDWFQSFSLLNVATQEGVFVGAIESCSIKSGALDMNILIKEKK